MSDCQPYTEIEVVFEETLEAEFPYKAQINGQLWQIRVNDFPDEPLHTLLIDDQEICDFTNWPSAWQIAPLKFRRVEHPKANYVAEVGSNKRWLKVNEVGKVRRYTTYLGHDFRFTFERYELPAHWQLSQELQEDASQGQNVMTTSSREAILNRLRQAAQPFTDAPPREDRLPVMPVAETDPAALLARFTAAAVGLSATVTPCADSAAAIQRVLELIGPDKAILSWDPARIPLPGLADALANAGIAIRPPDDPNVRVGLTGADAALATTGSLVITARPGQPRGVSLLPFAHVAIISQDQIVPNMEAWAAAQRADNLADFTAASNTLIVSGASRTADIAMELVMGAHGPAELHIIVLT